MLNGVAKRIFIDTSIERTQNPFHFFLKKEDRVGGNIYAFTVFLPFVSYAKRDSLATITL